ncbi:MAG TPA: hypothetical protein PKJ99_12380 [Thermoanaerobaculales bacterium]|nr:hypothetical protein [Thermoanaerobaculales bacterium]
MGEDIERLAALDNRELFPVTDEEVLQLIPEVAWAVARSAAATAVSDRILTTAEYEALAECATSLEGLSAFPGLMSCLVLRALGEEPSVSTALKQLKKSARDLPEQARQGILDAAQSLHRAQGGNAQAVHDQWARALGVSPKPVGSLPASPQGGVTRSMIDRGQSLLGAARARLLAIQMDPDVGLLSRAKIMASAFDDKELLTVVSRWEAIQGNSNRPDLQRAVELAAERALSAAAARLKDARSLDQQRQLADRFARATQALIDQVRARIVAIDQRLQLQSEMFAEDLENFIDGSLDALEIDMQNLMKGRKDWTDPSVWKVFKERAASAGLMVRFAPIKNRYTRLFDQWQRELDVFSAEARTIRATVLSSVDRRAFEALVPTTHSVASLKCALDRVSDATLGVSALGVLGAGAATAAGLVQITALAAALANPVGATLGGIVGAAALWKVGSNVERRKGKLVANKRIQIKVALRQLLESEGLNHDAIATDVLRKFIEAAVEQYTPLIVEARLWAMKARLELEVTERVLADTRALMALPTPTSAR